MVRALVKPVKSLYPSFVCPSRGVIGRSERSYATTKNALRAEKIQLDLPSSSPVLVPVGFNLVSPLLFQATDLLTTRRRVPDSIIAPNYAENGMAGLPRRQSGLQDAARIEGMRKACQLARHTLNFVGRHVEAGRTTDELDQLAFDFIVGHQAYPSPLMYRKYPKSICTSVNNVACHGIPDARQLQSGDIINVDVSVYTGGYHGDCSATYMVGEVDVDARRLIEVTKMALREAIKICRNGRRISEIGFVIDEIAESCGYSVMPAFCGHGIGEDFHMRPCILHISPDKLQEEDQDDTVMETGMIFTIEPVLSEGSHQHVLLADHWTCVSADNSRSAQFEETILIKEDGAEILTVV